MAAADAAAAARGQLHEVQHARQLVQALVHFERRFSSRRFRSMRDMVLVVLAAFATAFAPRAPLHSTTTICCCSAPPFVDTALA